MKNNKKNKKESEISNDVHYDSDIEIEATEYEGVSHQDKLKKLREEVKEAKKEAHEYLTGWQKERAMFANYKAEEEKKRSERVASLKRNLIIDFFPVLDSFDMAFKNKEAWEKVDPAWRSGIQYIHQQFMRILDDYSIELIDQEHIPFDPMLHDPVEHIVVDDKEKDGMILNMIQKGYKSGDIVLRPAKVNVGRYES